MNDNYIRNREGKIVGRIDGNILRDGTGKIVAKYDAWDYRTRNRMAALWATGIYDCFSLEKTSPSNNGASID